MALTATTTCPKCNASVLRVKLDLRPYFTIAVNATPDPTGHVVETSANNGRTLKADRSDVGGATVYKAHHLTCGST